MQKVFQSSLLVEEKKVPQLVGPSAQQCIELSAIFRALSDDKSRTLLNNVGMYPGDSNLFIQNLNLTRKQYCSKMDRLSKRGLLARKNGKNYLTTVGKIIYELQNIDAVIDYWKSRTINSLHTPDNLPDHELAKLIDIFIVNQGIM